MANTPTTASSAATASRDVASKEIDLRNRFHIAFNRNLFGIDADGNPLDGNIDGKSTSSRAKSNELTESEWKGNLDICLKWNNPDLLQCRAFRKENKRGYEVARKYVAVPITLPNGATQNQLELADRGKAKKGGGRIMLPRERIFDAIYHAHIEMGHMAAISTYKQLARTHANITLKQVKEFRRLCPMRNCDLRIPPSQRPKEQRLPSSLNIFVIGGKLIWLT